MVSWYVVQPVKIIEQGGRVLVGTKPTHTFIWDTLRVEGDEIYEVPYNMRSKYADVVDSVSVAYDSPFDGETLPEVALLRVQHEGDPPLDPEDYIEHLTTPQQWADLIADYPSLQDRFADQPRGDD